MFNLIFQKKIQGQKHPERWAIAWINDFRSPSPSLFRHYHHQPSLSPQSKQCSSQVGDEFISERERLSLSAFLGTEDIGVHIVHISCEWVRYLTSQIVLCEMILYLILNVFFYSQKQKVPIPFIISHPSKWHPSIILVERNNQLDIFTLMSNSGSLPQYK